MIIILHISTACLVMRLACLCYYVRLNPNAALASKSNIYLKIVPDLNKLAYII